MHPCSQRKHFTGRLRRHFLISQKKMSSSRKRSKVKDAEQKSKKHKVTPHYGLHNQGATCYLNSVLQVLSMTTEIHDRLEPRAQITDQELKNIFKKLKETTCKTENITQSLGIENVLQQRDAAECLELILNKISPLASEAFRGHLTYTTRCSSGHVINKETNPFWTLPLSLKDSHDSTFSVESGLEKFFRPKSFNGANMVYCSECEEKTEAESGCDMGTCPQILTLLLKRFDVINMTQTDRTVEVPRALEREGRRYDLYGMVNHMGSLRGGHYTAVILPSEDHTWYEFDDTRVNKVEEQPFAETETYSSSTAYLLVYRASGSPRDEVKEPEVDDRRDTITVEERHEKKVTMNGDVSVTSNSSRQPLDGGVEVAMLEKGCKKESENPQPRCKMHPLWIALIVVLGVLFVVLVVALPLVL
ncbi:putative ubiquitin carboxyl-terminal hydrolase 50 [Liparis tanakae]|uniref:Ubiquitin carboxyl-terminal hydrolase n=1 Tax=Liparis tanakae TaxID=230148 RepID=A0A4Z2I1U1_9TELE|nr:putative ubiquitin carboxyl-terminal hydrolase 50 [Liparis tanakae]